MARDTGLIQRYQPRSLLREVMDGYDRAKEAGDRGRAREIEEMRIKDLLSTREREAKTQKDEAAYQQTLRGVMGLNDITTPEGRTQSLRDLTRLGYGDRALGLMGQMPKSEYGIHYADGGDAYAVDKQDPKNKVSLGFKKYTDPKSKKFGIYKGQDDKGERQDYFYDESNPDAGLKPVPVKPAPGGTLHSYRDIEIPEEALPAWDRALTWFNGERKSNPSTNQIDLMERFVQEQMGDGIPRDMARQIQTKASSRINQVYGTGLRNPWQGTKAFVDAGKAALEGSELGITPPGTPKGKAGPGKPAAWSKDTRQAIQSITDKVKQDYNFKEHTESIAGAQKVLEAQAMAADTPAALAASITAVARMMAPGVVTDRDFAVLTDYGAPVGVRTWDQVAQWVTGQPPEMKSEVIAGISDILKKAAQRTSGDILNIAYESAQASGLNVDKDQLWQFIAPTSARQYLNMGAKPKAGTGPAKGKSADDYLKEAGL